MVGTLSWLWPLAVFLIAVADGSHAVEISAGSNGIAVVLSHAEHGTAPVRGHDRSLGHNHCLAASALVFLAEDATSQVDHVIQFGSSSPQLARLLSVERLRQNLVVTVLTFSPTTTGLSVPGVFPALGPRPPPALPAHLVQVRSTVLLV